MIRMSLFLRRTYLQMKMLVVKQILTQPASSTAKCVVLASSTLYYICLKTVEVRMYGSPEFLSLEVSMTALHPNEIPRMYFYSSVISSFKVRVCLVLPVPFNSREDIRLLKDSIIIYKGLTCSQLCVYPKFASGLE